MLAQDLLAFLLSDASKNGELLAFALETLVFVQTVEDLLLGLIPN